VPVVRPMVMRNKPLRDPNSPRVDLRRAILDVARAQQKALGLATTAVALLVIARLTLVPNGNYLPTHFDLCLPCGGSGTADFVLNVGLFVPLGFGLRLCGVRRWLAWTLALLLTVSIEVLQFYVVAGRDSDSSDIVANALGAAIGIAAVDLRRLWMTPTARVAGRLSAASALGLCIGAAGVQWILAPSFPHSIYYEQIAPDLPGYSLFDGVVLDASVDNDRLHIGRMSADASAAMRDSLLAGDATISVVMEPGTTRRDVAPIVDVHDQKRREIFMLAQHGNDLIFRLHRRSNVLGFHPPSAILADALPQSLAQSDTAIVRVGIAPGSTTIDVGGLGSARQYAVHQRIGQGIWDLWRLLIPDDGRWASNAGVLLVVSVVLLFAPIGYWAGRAAVREGISISATTVLMPVAATLAIIPWAAGSPVAPLSVWAAGLGGGVLGWGIGRWTVG
jgi:hypothetical protein